MLPVDSYLASHRGAADRLGACTAGGVGVHLFRGGDLTCKRGLKDRVWGILGSFRHHSVSHMNMKTWEFFKAKDFN